MVSAPANWHRKAMDWIRSNIRRLHGLLRRRGWQKHDAEDVIQDAFMRMQAFCNDGGEVRNPEAFLVRTALNLSINLRTRKRDHATVAQLEPDCTQPLQFAPAADDVLAAEDSLKAVVSLVDTMTPRTREIFLMHYLEGYTYPQIAQQLGISVSAIEKHVARAMLALTQELRDGY